METIIHLDHITKDYGNGKGVFDISFDIKRGEAFGYLGPNGAGKTTTIRQLMGFIKPDAGELSIFGMECFSHASEIQKRMGYIAGELTFMEDMTGKSFLTFQADMRGMKDLSRMQELMEFFELNPQGKIRKMSKGMKQKIGIICAFMDHPDVVILDEPTSGLDPLMQQRFVELILEEKRRGTTILMSSHIFEEVEKTCDRTAIVRAGKIVAVEDMQQLSKKREKTYLVTLKDEKMAQNLAGQLSKLVKQVRGTCVELTVRDNIAAVLRTIAEFEPMNLDIRTQGLEELFLQYYGNEKQAEGEGKNDFNYFMET